MTVRIEKCWPKRYCPNKTQLFKYMIWVLFFILAIIKNLLTKGTFSKLPNGLSCSRDPPYLKCEASHFTLVFNLISIWLFVTVLQIHFFFFSNATRSTYDKLSWFFFWINSLNRVAQFVKLTTWAHWQSYPLDTFLLLSISGLHRICERKWVVPFASISNPNHSMPWVNNLLFSHLWLVFHRLSFLEHQKPI